MEFGFWASGGGVFLGVLWVWVFLGIWYAVFKLFLLGTLLCACCVCLVGLGVWVFLCRVFFRLRLGLILGLGCVWYLIALDLCLLC